MKNVLVNYMSRIFIGLSVPTLLVRDTRAASFPYLSTVSTVNKYLQFQGGESHM